MTETTTDTTTTTLSDARKVAARTIGIALDCVRFGDRRQGDLSKVEVDADKDQLVLGKHLVPRRRRRAQAMVVPQAAADAGRALTAVERVDFDAQEYLKRVGLPSYFRPGTHRIPLALVEEVEVELAKYAEIREPLVDDFCVRYPGLVDAMREPLGSQYRREDYPPVEDVRARFSFSWRWFELDGVPDRVEAVSTEAYRAAKRRMDAELKQVADGCRLALRSYLYKLVETIAGRLAGEADETPKQFRQSTLLAGLSDFFRTFPLRNVTDDAELEQLVGELQALTSNVDLDEVKDDVSLQRALRSQLDRVADNLDDLLVARGSREITLPEAS